AGAADSVSAVCRQIINQTVTPDHMRGRMSSVFSLVVTSGPRLGDIESGVVAGATTPRFSVTSGGLAKPPPVPRERRSAPRDKPLGVTPTGPREAAPHRRRGRSVVGVLEHLD